MRRFSIVDMRGPQNEFVNWSWLVEKKDEIKSQVVHDRQIKPNKAVDKSIPISSRQLQHSRKQCTTVSVVVGKLSTAQHTKHELRIEPARKIVSRTP